jgi:hypothetical protein
MSAGDPLYQKGALPRSWHKEAHEYRKKLTIRAMRIAGPFCVWTAEGVMYCDDGWLALDVDGNPYPISNNVFHQTYEPTS